MVFFCLLDPVGLVQFTLIICLVLAWPISSVSYGPALFSRLISFYQQHHKTSAVIKATKKCKMLENDNAIVFN